VDRDAHIVARFPLRWFAERGIGTPVVYKYGYFETCLRFEISVTCKPWAVKAKES
jgi:hypothetical protein